MTPGPLRAPLCPGHERVWAGALGRHWRMLQQIQHCPCPGHLTRHPVSGERFSSNWIENMKINQPHRYLYILYLLRVPHWILSKRLLDTEFSENQELIVTINTIQVWSVLPCQPIRGQCCDWVTNQRPASQPGYNWVCNCVSLRYKCHISDITDIRLGVPDINADLHRDNNQKRERWRGILDSGFAIKMLFFYQSQNCCNPQLIHTNIRTYKYNIF